MRWHVITLLYCLLCIAAEIAEGKGLVWKNPDAKLDDRVDALLKVMKLSEKLSQLNTNSPEVQRIGLSAFNWWAECIHGAMEMEPNRHGGTIFPQPLGMAASFSPTLLSLVATAVSDELRAMSNHELGNTGSHRGLNCFGPNINILRDPRWGRGSETYGEDPFLTSVLSAAFVKGLQGEHDKYIKVGATCKHFAAYSMEQAEGETRFNFNAKVDPKDLADTYMPAFQGCITAGGATSVMCSYNAVNGVPACANAWLLQDILRKAWKFEGFVVSDCAAIQAITLWHNFTMGYPHGAASSLKAGVDLACDEDYKWLEQGIDHRLVNEKEIDVALGRVLKQRFKLAMFDTEVDPWKHLKATEVIGNKTHRSLAIQAARESIVLLKNELHSDGKPTLPLPKENTGKVVVIGMMANATEYMLGNYYGYPSAKVRTPLEAIRRKLKDKNGMKVEYYEGPAPVIWKADSVYWSEMKCRGASVCIFVVGSVAGSAFRSRYQPDKVTDDSPLFSAANENEELDRKFLTLPGPQEDAVLAAAKRTHAKIVVVLIHGGPLDVSKLHHNPRVGAILTAWYPGQGAAAIADVIFGDYNPSGRLPVTFYYNNYTEQVSPLSMDMRAWPGRTYRFVQVPVLYPFGYGLSYTTVEYKAMQVETSVTCDENGDPQPVWDVQVSLLNTGTMATEYVLLLFVHHGYAEEVMEQRKQWVMPQRTLRAFRRFFLEPGMGKVINIHLRWGDFLQPTDTNGDMRIKSGPWVVQVGDLEESINVPSRMQVDCSKPETLNITYWETLPGMAKSQRNNARNIQRMLGLTEPLDSLPHKAGGIGGAAAAPSGSSYVHKPLNNSEAAALQQQQTVQQLEGGDANVKDLSAEEAAAQEAAMKQAAEEAAKKKEEAEERRRKAAEQAELRRRAVERRNAEARQELEKGADDLQADWGSELGKLGTS